MTALGIWLQHVICQPYERSPLSNRACRVYRDEIDESVPIFGSSQVRKVQVPACDFPSRRGKWSASR
jgi:hypothetical protein